MEKMPDTADKKSKYWCNFCGFVTADEKAYLAHSCTEELRRKEKLPPPDVREDNCR